ncbi:MAG: hypothetical protein ACOZQL_21655 [Myxococcota bacterium]
MERMQPGGGGGEREKREELERLQGELAKVRRALATGREEHERALRAMREAVKAAELARDGERARLASLEAEVDRRKQRVKHLAERVEQKRQEDELLALGAARRDVVFIPNERTDGAQSYYRVEVADDPARLMQQPDPPPYRPLLSARATVNLAVGAVFVLFALFMYFMVTAR